MNKLLLYLIAIIVLWVLVINPLNSGKAGSHTDTNGEEHGGGGASR